MPNNIWLDGANGTGKTTLANELVNYGFKYYHNGRPIIKRGWYIVLKYVIFELTHKNAVVDRCFVSEWVHGNYERKRSSLSIKQCIFLEKFISRFGSGLTIFAPEDVESTADRIAKREEEHPLSPDKDMLSEIITVYEAYSVCSGHPLCRVKYASDVLKVHIAENL